MRIIVEETKRCSLHMYKCMGALRLEYTVHVHVLTNTCTQATVYVHVLTSIHVHVLRACCNCIHTCTYRLMYGCQGGTGYTRSCYDTARGR